MARPGEAYRRKVDGMDTQMCSHTVHLLHSEEVGHRLAVCGAVEYSFAGERLNFTIDPGYVECARCVEVGP